MISVRKRGWTWIARTTSPSISKDELEILRKRGRLTVKRDRGWYIEYKQYVHLFNTPSGRPIYEIYRRRIRRKL